MFNRFALLLLFLSFLASCGEEDTPTLSEDSSFDREEMLAGWMDQTILPAYEDTHGNLLTLKDFLERGERDELDLGAIQGALKFAYLSWQSQSPFILAEAETLRLREQSNTYPADPEQILANVAEGSYNLELPSMAASQGFPALEYLLHGSTPE